MRLIFLLAIFAIIGIFVTNDAYALSCEQPDPAKYYEESDTVFAGKVISKEYQQPSSEHSLVAHSVFEVIEPFKGILQDPVIVSSDERFWGINFTVGSEYLVFGDYFDDAVELDLCGPTSIIEFSHIDQIRQMKNEIILSPLKQFKNGTPYHEIKCNTGLQLTQRYDGAPACVRPDTYFELIKRDWVSDIIKAVQSRDLSDPTSSFMEEIIPTLADFRETLSDSYTMETIFEKFGEPHDDIGSGIHIYVYELNDLSQIWIGYSDHIWYIQHVDSEGVLLEELFVDSEN